MNLVDKRVLKWYNGVSKIKKDNLKMEREVVKINGEYYFLDGWNGEKYCDCWKCDKYGNCLSSETFEIREMLEGIGEPDEDGLFEEYETIGYEII